MIKILSFQPAVHPNRYVIDKTVVLGQAALSGIGLGLLEYTLLKDYTIRFLATPFVGITAAALCYFLVMRRATHTLIARAENSIKSQVPLPPDTVALIKNHRSLFDKLKEQKNQTQAQFELALHFKDSDFLCTFLNQDKGISVSKEQLDTLVELVQLRYLHITTTDVLQNYVFKNDHITDAINLLWVNIHYNRYLHRKYNPPNLFIRAIEERKVHIVTYLLKNNKAGFYDKKELYAAWSKSRDPQIAQVLQEHGIQYEPPSPPPPRAIPDLSTCDSYGKADHLKQAIASTDTDYLKTLLLQIDNVNGLFHSLLNLEHAKSAEVLMLLKEKGLKINASAVLSKVIQRDVCYYTSRFTKQTHLQLLISMGAKPSQEDLSLCRSTFQHDLIPILEQSMS